MPQTNTQHTDPQFKAKYGIDAPGVIRNLFLGSIAFAAISLFFPLIRIGSVNIDTHGLYWSAGGCALGGALMLLYSLFGKFKHRDRMLRLACDWTGSEQVLDIGTGRGLLMIGAAKKLKTGKATGIDIWNTEDLSGNKIQHAINNTIAEGVYAKTEILNNNAMNMSFADSSFDVILTNQVIHNIYNKDGRKKACHEIARVLKPGGVAVISDFRHMKDYKRTFDELGLETKMHPADYLTTFPALDILIVRK